MSTAPENTPKKRNWNAIVIVLLVVVLLILTGVTYYLSTKQTGATQSDTLFSLCRFSGQGSFVLRVVSDSTGAAVQPDSITGILRFGMTCNETSEIQVAHVSRFDPAQNGWLTPALSDGTDSIGTFSISVQYSGKTYNFAAEIKPVSLTCVTLRVPSGNVTVVMSYLSSDCAQP